MYYHIDEIMLLLIYTCTCSICVSVCEYEWLNYCDMLAHFRLSLPIDRLKLGFDFYLW